MEISATKFDSDDYGSTEVGSNANGFLLHHNIDVYNRIIINGEAFEAVYQTGVTFDFDDYNHPNNKLELSEEGGTHEMLCYINTIEPEDFESGAQEHLDFVSGFCAAIKTKEDLKEVYELLKNNDPGIIVED